MSILESPELVNMLPYKAKSYFTYAIKVKDLGGVRWLMLVIPALGEAKAGGSQSQEFEISLTNIVKPCLS